MTFQSFDTWWWPYLFILLAGWLPTDMWRWLGVYFSGNLDENSEVFVAVRALATALVAAIIAKLILFPTGSLAETSIILRIVAASAGFGIFLLTGQRVFVGIFTAEAIIIGGWWWAL